jgi:hypothetical protein
MTFLLRFVIRIFFPDIAIEAKNLCYLATCAFGKLQRERKFPAEEINARFWCEVNLAPVPELCEHELMITDREIEIEFFILDVLCRCVRCH